MLIILYHYSRSIYFPHKVYIVTKKISWDSRKSSNKAAAFSFSRETRSGQSREVFRRHDVGAAKRTIALLLKPGPDAVPVELVSARIQGHHLGQRVHLLHADGALLETGLDWTLSTCNKKFGMVQLQGSKILRCQHSWPSLDGSTFIPEENR